jgi:hypothetical protein
MSTFRYHNKFGEAMSGVECDACSFRLYTDTEDQCFGEHMRTAKQNGWLITKKCGKWLNLCPKCKEALEAKKRSDWLMHSGVV